MNFSRTLALLEKEDLYKSMDEDVGHGNASGGFVCAAKQFASVTLVNGPYGLLGWAMLILPLACVLLFLEEMSRVIRVSGASVRKTVILLALMPFEAVAALIAEAFPRYAIICDLAIIFMLSVAIFTFLHLMLDYFGGDTGMLNALSGSNFNMRNGKCGKFCICFGEESTLTPGRLSCMKICVMQILFIKIAEMIIGTVLYFIDPKLYCPGHMDFNSLYPYLTVVAMISTFVSMWALTVIHNVAHEIAPEFNLTGKLAIIQSCITFSNVQRFILSLFLSEMESLKWHHFILMIEMLVMSLSARKVYNDNLMKGDDDPSKNVPLMPTNSTAYPPVAPYGAAPADTGYGGGYPQQQYAYPQQGYGYDQGYPQQDYTGGQYNQGYADGYGYKQ